MSAAVPRDDVAHAVEDCQRGLTDDSNDDNRDEDERHFTRRVDTAHAPWLLHCAFTHPTLQHDISTHAAVVRHNANYGVVYAI